MSVYTRFILPALAVGLFAVSHPSLAVGQETQADTLKDEADEASAQAVIARFKEKDPEMKEIFDKAAGYAVFPTSSPRGQLVSGGARGKGTVYEASGSRGLGRSTLTQVSIGFQLGGQAYSEVVFFHTKEALENFKKGTLKVDAQASAVALKERASGHLPYREGVAIVTMSKGGLMYEASVGGQKFSYKPI